MKKRTKQIAFFDIDKTVIKINSGEALVRQAYQNGLMSTYGLLKAIYTGIQYKYELADTHTLIRKMGGWLNGLSEETFNKISQQILKKDLLPNVRPKIVKEIQDLRKKGIEVVILSSAIQHVCIPLAKYLHVDAVICSKLEVINGKLTGKPVGKYCFRDEKLIQLKAFCKEKNYKLEHAAYYADSIDDLPALNEVGHPVCVSPDKKLEKIAQEQGWIIQYW